ncbi:MAG TPA: DnaJ domain-containing protein [Nitrososphaera sp.]|nr:DnaJ domain-containing protein [Nitrososphaera sp.]
MTDSKGYYAILGVPEKASYREIKQAYRKLARKYHPDRNSSAFAEDMIKKINAAFEVLSDATKRSQYDKTEYEENTLPPSTSESASVEQEHANSSVDHQASSGKAVNESTVADFFNGPYSLDTPKGRFHIIVEPSLCMAFGSCETLAPKTFVVEKNKRVNPKAIVECETCENFSRIYAAAQTCPTKAIKIVDRYTGEQVYP